MKTILAVVAATVALFAFTPTKAEAGNYRTKVIGHCSHCHQNIYAYYKPIRYSDGCVRYVWVPSYHRNCAASAHRHSSSYNRYSNRLSPAEILRRNYVGPSRRYSPSRSGVSFSVQFGNRRFCW